MDNSSIESLKLVRSNNQDLLNFFNDSYIARLEQIQSLKTEEFELRSKIEQLLKTLDVYSFKTSAGHNVFSPFSVDTTSQQEKAVQIELQLKELQDMQETIKAQIKEEEEETSLLKNRIANLSSSNRHLDDIITEISDEVSSIDDSSGESDNNSDTASDAASHGINILRLQQYDRKKLSEQIQSDITDVLDSNSHKLEVLSWLIRSDINRAKVTLEELTASTSKLADHVDDMALSLASDVDTDEPLYTLLNNLMQSYKDEHPECSISSDIDCTDQNIVVSDIVTTNIVYIIKELMNNIFTHSSASKVTIKIYISSKLVDVYINDNGTGIDENYLDNSPWYSGLHKIKEVIYLLSGTLKIDGDTSNGTSVRFSLPL